MVARYILWIPFKAYSMRALVYRKLLFTEFMPIEDREIYGCAKFMIDKHGEDATFHAALRADELHEAADLDGQRTWQRIIKAIATLESDGKGQIRH